MGPLGALRHALPCAALLCALALPGSAAAETLPVRPADAFIDSVGVTIHATYTDTPYARGDRVIEALETLGVRHVRDGVHANGDPRFQWVKDRQAAFVAKLAAAGVKADFVVGPPDGRSGTLDQQLAQLRDRFSGAAESVEGANEWDQSGDAAWPVTLRAHQQALYRAVKADPELRRLPVLAPSLGHTNRLSELGNIEAFSDFGNLHLYPAGLAPGGAWLDTQLAQARSAFGSEPIMATEAGYHNALAAGGVHLGTSQRAVGTYLPRLFLEHFRRGIPRTFAYELLDEKPDPGRGDMGRNFGLLRMNFSPKPAATALADLLKVVRGPAGRRAGGPAAVDLAVTGAAAGSHRMALRQRDGSVLVLLWQDGSVWDAGAKRDLTAPPLKGKLAAGFGFNRIEVRRPSSHRARVARRNRPGTQLAISVPAGEVLAVRLSGAARVLSRRARSSRRWCRALGRGRAASAGPARSVWCGRAASAARARLRAAR